ncbi:MAG: hypothetical protein Q9164_003732 [Protoblastenia rupestris]
MPDTTKFVVDLQSTGSPRTRKPRQQGPLCIHSPEQLSSCIQDLHGLDINCPLNSLDEFEKGWQLRELCGTFVHAVKSGTDHLAQIDFQFCKLLPGAYRIYPDDVKEAASPQRPGEDVISKTKHILSRMPRVPQRLFSLPINIHRMREKRGTIWDSIKSGKWKNTYILPEARSLFRTDSPDSPLNILDYLTDMKEHGWDNLFVTSYIDTNSLLLLMKVASLDHTPNEDFAGRFLQYVNLVSELIEEYETLVSLVNSDYQQAFSDPAPSVQALKAALFPEASSEHEMSLYVLKAFLWSAWQRSIMLYFFYIVGVQIWHGPTPSWNTMLAVRSVQRLVELRRSTYRGSDVPYLCNCAFELLRTSRSSLALDFRGLIDRFDSQFPEVKGRCIKDSDASCNGDVLDSCQRFVGAETKAQSCHAAGCNRECPKIAWDEISYRKCANPRAVIAEFSPTASTLEYSKASSETMAISHVWSHGQGGRPEDGINLCLHKRYCSLASTLGCKSYWIDSTCIPDDEKLRNEAIMSINWIFFHSKVTLISDSDLQSISIENQSIAELESLLSVLLVCDWGVRAWTMLEAIKGNATVQILCKDDSSVALKVLLQRVHQDGAVDISVLLGCVQHLLPSVDPRSTNDPEEIGHLLSRRHASRNGDDLIIWSLLGTGKAQKRAENFWEMCDQVKSGFLVSGAPRVENVTGMSWAPTTPYIRPQHRSVALGDGFNQQYTVYYPSYDGRGSLDVQRKDTGLLGKWLCLDVDWDLIEKSLARCQESKTSNLWLDKIRDTFVHNEGGNQQPSSDIDLFPRPDVANACATLEILTQTPGAQIKLLRPLAADGVSVYDGANRRGEDFSLLVVICMQAELTSIETSNDGRGWKWHGVFEWEDESVEDWTVEELLIV